MSAKRKKTRADPKTKPKLVSIVEKTQKVYQVESRVMIGKYTKAKTKNVTLKKENRRLYRRLDRRLERFFILLSKNDTKEV